MVFVAAGVSLLVGGCAACYIVRRKLTDQILSLNRQMDLLRQEVDRLRNLVEELLPPRQARIEKNTSFHNSSFVTSDDDEVYEDAYGGPLPWLTGLRSTAFISEGDARSITSDEYLSANSFSSLDSDDTALLFMQVDRLFEGTDKDKQEALDLLSKKKSKLSSDANFVWRLAKATYFKSQIIGTRDKEEQKKLVYDSKDLANDALQIDERNSNAHKWFAIALGSTNDYESVKVKIQNGYDFKKHIERAIELNPTDPTAHYLLGRWCFGVYMLSWVERRAAATLFAAPPTATVEEALDHFLEADRLKPGSWKENLLFIGKCYIQKRDYSTAVQYLEKADALPTMGQDDELSQQEITSLLSQYNSYRN